jgi:hypothetical protein
VEQLTDVLEDLPALDSAAHRGERPLQRVVDELVKVA